MSATFEEKVYSGYYGLQRENSYLRKKAGLQPEPETFMEELMQFLHESGVPARYVSKVASYAYRDGHSAGETEVYNIAVDLVEIFK